MAENCFPYITINGQSKYDFQEPNTSNNYNPLNKYPCYLAKDHRGKKILSNQTFSKGNIIFSEKSLITIPTGKHFNRICWKCLKYGHNSVKVSSESNKLFFCSHHCLNVSSRFIEVCGQLIDHLFDLKYSHNMIFCVKIMYSIEIEKNIELFEQINKHEQHKAIEMNELNEIVQQLLSSIHQFSSCLLQNVVNPSQLIESILRCLHFNSQPHNIISLINTQFLSFYSNLSRLNHSCHANTILTYHISSITSSLIASLIVIRPIAIGEELTISYLSEYCQALPNRQQLLLNSFLFDCQCNRCIIEQKYFYFDSKQLELNSNDSTFETEISTITCNDSSYEISDLIRLKTYLNECLLIIQTIEQKLQFLIILQTIFQQVNERILFLKLKWRSLLTAVTQSLTDNRFENNIQTKQIFSELHQIYTNFYYYYEINLLLFFYVMTEKNVSAQDTLGKFSSTSQNGNGSLQLHEYQIKREMFLIEICKLIKSCWKLCYEFSEMKTFEECSVGIFWNSQSVIQILLTGGNAASHLIANSHENSRQFPEISELVNEGHQMVQECQTILSTYYSFPSELISARLLTTIIPSSSSLVCGSSSSNLLEDIQKDIQNEYAEMKHKINKLEQMF